MSLEKICVSVTCIHKSHCAIWKRLPEDLHQQYLTPVETGDACHFYAPKKESIPWGVGADQDD